ncbi:band 4.1-like protein 5 [Clytia hemisphaerica]|uniref:FERM domain-containing protein n=1 Tax=Clytia hemisphaerica TaxID=252671 RepID=A0A7M5XIU9_9CNID
MVFDNLRRSLRNTFRRKSKRERGPVSADGKRLLPCSIQLLDGTDVTINLQRDALGKDLIKRVLLHLDLVEKDYFALQYMDSKNVPHWIDPVKKVKKQVSIGPPYSIHFRMKFYPIEPHKLHEELTRYHCFLQIKNDVREGKLKPSLKQSIEMGAFAVQSELGDFDNTLHVGNYVSEFRLAKNQNEEMEKGVEKKHRLLSGMNPAECETHYLAIAGNLECYGMDRHPVKGEDGREYTVGLTPHGIVILRGDQKIGFHIWKSITNITFKQSRFIMCAKTNENETQEYRYELGSPRASKHLWKCAIEYHTFFRLVAPTEAPERKQGLLTFGSRFRYSGRTLHQADKDNTVNARKSNIFKRTRSERFAQRSTIGYIRIGSNVWARAVNGDYYRGVVTALTDKVHVKFEDGETISHERKEEEALVYDMAPNPNEIKIGTRVIAHWSGVAAYLPGAVTKIEGNKYQVLYDDGDRLGNRLEQMRILKPPLYFGPGSGRSNLQKKYSMKTTALIGSSSTSEDGPKRSASVDINRARTPRTPADDDAFFPDRKGSPQVPRSKSSPAITNRNAPAGGGGSSKSDDQNWNANLSSSSKDPAMKRTQSAPGKKAHNNNQRNGAAPTRSHSHSSSKGYTVDKNTPALNARLVPNAQTGKSYQITDL